MASHNVTAFIPMRKGSERAANKNFKKFATMEGGLIHLKLEQIMEIDVDEVVVSTNDENVIEVAERFIPIYRGKLRIVKRPDHLCLSSTPVKELIDYVPTVVRTDHVLWLHVTSPLFNTYTDFISKYWAILARGYDSLITVTEMKEFLMNNEGNIINSPNHKMFEPSPKWPRTQDLEPLYIVNHACYMSSIYNYLKYHDRVGCRPALYITGKVPGLDIDFNEDFMVAEALFNIDPERYLKRTGVYFS